MTDDAIDNNIFIPDTPPQDFIALLFSFFGYRQFVSLQLSH